MNKAKPTTTTEVTKMTAIDEKPRSLWLVGPTTTTLAKAVVLIRQGYMVDMASPIEMFGPSGSISLTLCLGSPGDDIVNEVAKMTAEAAELQSAEHQRQIEAAAKRLIEERERTAKQAAIQAQIEAQQKQIRQLQASLASA